LIEDFRIRKVTRSVSMANAFDMSGIVLTRKVYNLRWARSEEVSILRAPVPSSAEFAEAVHAGGALATSIADMLFRELLRSNRPAAHDAQRTF
jgi:hypothetical protein